MQFISLNRYVPTQFSNSYGYLYRYTKVCEYSSKGGSNLNTKTSTMMAACNNG